MTDHDVDMQAREDHRIAQLPTCRCGIHLEDPNLCAFCESPMCCCCAVWVDDVGWTCTKCKAELDE